jgi:acetyl-CoA acetyltransferase
MVAMHNFSIAVSAGDLESKMKEQFGVDAMGETAENLVDRDKVSREDQDKFSFNSQRKAKAAQERGRFAKEIIAVEIPGKKGEVKIFDKDEFM